MELLEQIKKAVEYIQSKIEVKPEIGIILGTGLGGLADEIDTLYKIPYQEVPHSPISTVKGHNGKFVIGRLGGKVVIAMSGRFHYYEGYTMQQVTFPVRVMALLGIKNLFVSNASGGVNPEYEIGEIMLISDHLNLFPSNPLTGRNIEELGPRFPDMSDAYDENLLQIATEVADELNIRIAKGIYAGVTGPTLETPAEYKMMRVLGADAVGMSTIPEVIVARHMEIPCFAVSIITDIGVEGRIVKVSAQDVIDVANQQEEKMTKIIIGLIERI